MGRRDLAPAAASLRPRRVVALAALALVPCALLGCAAGRRAEPPRVTAAAPAPTRGPRSIATLAEDVDDPDGDGVRAAADLCPTLAEDCDRFHDEDGCPDRDDDGDSIPDFCDECPRAAESWNAVNDTDGCSDAVDARGSDRPPFDAMSPMPRLASIARAPAVAQWVRALQAAPHITRVDVVGEAAPDEPDAAVLALQRAEAAAAAMVARGIAATRVRAVGHAPRAEESSVSGIMRFTRSASSARVSLVVAAIGGRELTPHEALDGVANRGWAPESMTCTDGRGVAAQPRDGSVIARGTACVERRLAPTRVRSYQPGLLIVDAVPTATAACSALLAAAYPEMQAEADCAVAYGVATASRVLRGVAILAIHLPDTLTPVWLALSGDAGFTTFHRIDDFPCSSMSDPHFTVDALAFRANESELLIAWRELDIMAEGLDDEEFERALERAATTLCRWESAAGVESIVCHTADSGYRDHQTTRRNERVVSRQREEGRVELRLDEGGALEIAPLAGRRAADAGRLRATLGRYAWGAWPTPPPPP